MRNIKGLIYLATNKKNDKKYVGLTLRPLKRCIQSHVAAALKGKGYEHTLQEAIRKFGIESITYEVIAKTTSLEELGEKEKFYNEKNKTLSPFGYNMNRGGSLSEGGKIYIVDGEEYHRRFWRGM